MCNACGFLCCAYDGFSGCGCDDCPYEACWSDDDVFDQDDDFDYDDGLDIVETFPGARPAPMHCHGVRR